MEMSKLCPGPSGMMKTLASCLAEVLSVAAGVGAEAAASEAEGGGSVEADSVEDWDRWVDQKC